MSNCQVFGDICATEKAWTPETMVQAQMQTPSTELPFPVPTGVKPSLPILAREDAAG